MSGGHTRIDMYKPDKVQSDKRGRLQCGACDCPLYCHMYTHLPLRCRVDATHERTSRSSASLAAAAASSRRRVAAAASLRSGQYMTFGGLRVLQCRTSHLHSGVQAAFKVVLRCKAVLT